METKTFSPLLTAANNIVKTKRPLSKGAKDYDAFVNWLGVSNKDIKKIKLPKVKKVENLEFSVGSALGGGGGGGGILGLLLGGAAGGLGVRFLGKGINAVKGFGKNAISKIFPRVAIPAAKKAAIPAADMARKGVVKGWEHIATGAPRAIATGTDDAAKIAATQGGRIAKSFGKFGASIIPGIGAVVGVADATLRSQAGDEAGAAIAGTGAALDAAAAASAATGIGLPIAGLLSIASFALDLTNLVRDLSGMSSNEEEKPKNKIETRLKEQERTQREAASASNVTFVSITDKFDKVVSKFEKFASGMGAVSMDRVSKNSEQESYKTEGTEGGNNQPPPPPGPGQTYDGPVSGDSFYPLPGGSLSTRANGYYRGEYGTERDYLGGHSGQDIGGLGPGSPVVAWKTGKITYTGSVESGDTVLTIDHGNGVQSRYKHVVPSVSDGSVVYGGQQIATLFNSKAYQPHLHFEVWKNGSHVNPNPEINKSQKIPAPLSIRDAKNKNDKSSAGTSGVQGAQTAILAAGTNDYGDPAKVKENVEKSIKDLKSKGYNVVVVPPNEKGQFAGAHKAVLQAAASSGATVEKGKYNTDDPLHLKMSEALRIKQKFAGAEILGDSNAVRIAGGSMSNVAGKRVVGAGTGDILKFVRDMRRVGPAATSQVVPAPTQPIPAAVAAPLQTQTPGGTVVLMGNMQPQVAARPSIVPVPIPMGGGQSSGGGVVVVSPSEGDILNSLWKTMLLTNLSAA